MPNEILTTYLTPIALALMMVGMGLSLVPSDFNRLLKHPKAVIIGLSGQILGMPLLGLLIATTFTLLPWQSAGIMVLVSCADGIVSGLLTQIAKGDTALSITMTALSMMIGIFTIPIIINASMAHFMQQQYIELNLINTSLRLFAMTIVPVVLGMVLRYWAPSFALRFKSDISRLSNTLLILIILLTLYNYRDEILGASSALWLPLLWLNLLAMLLGYSCAHLASLGSKVSKTLVIELAIQNSATGIFIASVLLNDSKLALPAIIYTGIAFINIALFMFTLRTRHVYAKQI